MEDKEAHEDLHEAVFGKPHVGLSGLVTQVNEQQKDLVRERDARSTANKQLREANEQAIRQLRGSSQQAHRELWKTVKANTRRIDRMVWIAIGTGAGAGSGGAFLGTLLRGGP